MSAFVDRLKRLRAGDVLRRQRRFYGEAREVLTRLEGADLAARREWTRARLEEVTWSARRTRYGKTQRGEHAQWPLLRKPQVQVDPTAFRAPALLTIKASTGGTSGAPLRLFRSLRSIVFEQACLDLMMEKLGVDAVQARTAVLRTDTIKDPNDFRPPYWVDAGGGRRRVFSSSHLNAATLNAYVEALESFDPDILLGYPTSLEWLCLLLARAEQRVKVARVMCSSEMLHPHVWRQAQARLGCALLDYYGQAERVAFAYATAPGEYRFLPGYSHVEFAPVADATPETGLRTYEVIGTPLWNLAMPLIRYCTGDLLRLPAHWGAAELEELALGVRTFEGVLGRDGDILLTPEGAKVTGISHFQRDVPHLVRIQIIQEREDFVRILVLAAPGYSASDEALLEANVRRKLPHSMSVQIERAESLERTARGKTPFVIHRAAVKSALQRGQVSEGRA